MPIQVIAMLTHDDKTVPNALEAFEANKHARTACWGFKDIGIAPADAVALVRAMKAAGKTTFLEPLLEDEESCLRAAAMAADCGFDAVIGMVYNEKAHALLKANGIRYLPTCGRRAGLPRMLYGAPAQIVADARRLTLDCGADGVCLSTFRYVEGDPEAMSLAVNQAVSADLIISGGINDFGRLDFVKRLKPWGFTIGSALFMGKFGKGMPLAAQLDCVQDYIEAETQPN